MQALTMTTPERERTVDCVVVPLTLFGVWMGQLKRDAGRYGETLEVAAEMNGYVNRAINERKVVTCGNC